MKKGTGMTGLANRNCDNLSDMTFMNALVHNFNVSFKNLHSLYLVLMYVSVVLMTSLVTDSIYDDIKF